MTRGVDVAVIRTGVANLASVLAGLERAGATPRFATTRHDVLAANAVVLPGVGSFDAGAAALAESGLAAALRERIATDRPTLAVCLGLQLLLDGSDESRERRAGLGIVSGRAQRYPERVRVPQLGWNRITADPACQVLRSGHVFFANSFRLVERPPGLACAVADHGGPFVAAFERGRLLACQFHPELSGRFGRELLRRFVTLAGESIAC